MISTHILLSSLLLISSLVNGIIAIPTRRAPPASLPITRHARATGSSKLADADRARANILKSLAFGKLAGQTRDVPVPVTNHGVYTADVGVGSGTYTLIIDTGSSNTWVGAGKSYQPGPNSQDTGEQVSVQYGTGSFSGKEFTDDVTLGSATIVGQSIGVASQSTGFNGVDGILGVGPTDLTQGTTSGGGTIPTVTDNLFSQGTIPENSIGISFEPTTSLNDQSGELTFGGVDPSKFTGDITYVPITTTSPASQFWGIDESIVYGAASTPILSTTAGIVDTGTTLISLATDAYQAYVKATGATKDEATGLLKMDSSQYDSLESLFFHIGGSTFELSANGQIWPRALNSLIGGDANSVYLIVSDLGTPSGQGLDFINGFTFLQRFYSVYDTANRRVGIATTPHTYDTTN